MKKIICCTITAALVNVIGVVSSFGGGFYAPRYSHHAPYYHYGPRIHHHGIHGGDIWLGLGLGLLSGVVIGSIAAAPARPPAALYTYSRPVIVERPQIVHQVPVYMERNYPVEQELVLREVITTAELLNVRSTPDLQAGIIGQVKRDQVLSVIGAAPEWLYVKTADGYYGWVMSQYTENSSQPVG